MLETNSPEKIKPRGMGVLVEPPKKTKKGA